MKIENIPLNESEIEKIAQIDESIRRRSIDLGVASLKVRSIEAQLSGLYEARNKTLDDKVKASGLDYSKVRNVGVAPDPSNPQLAIVVVQMDESEPSQSEAAKEAVKAS